MYIIKNVQDANALFNDRRNIDHLDVKEVWMDWGTNNIMICLNVKWKTQSELTRYIARVFDLHQVWYIIADCIEQTWGGPCE